MQSVRREANERLELKKRLELPVDPFRIFKFEARAFLINGATNDESPSANEGL